MIAALCLLSGCTSSRPTQSANPHPDVIPSDAVVEAEAQALLHKMVGMTGREQNSLLTYFPFLQPVTRLKDDQIYPATIDAQIPVAETTRLKAKLRAISKCIVFVDDLTDAARIPGAEQYHHLSWRTLSDRRIEVSVLTHHLSPFGAVSDTFIFEVKGNEVILRSLCLSAVQA